jgi:hypothetical protein
MIIGGVDVKFTQRLHQRVKRSERKVKQFLPIPTTSNTISDDSSDSEIEEKFISDNNYHPRNAIVTKRVSARLSFKKLSEVCDRYGVSYRAGAAIASATLHDVKSPHIVDHSKLRRERQRRREILLKRQKINSIEALYFDGRKDKTMCFVKKEKKIYRHFKVEEHITLVQEPGSIYISHITPPSGTAEDIEVTMFTYLNREYSLNKLMAIGCDGTNVNTGRKNGIISRIEKRIKKPLQWLICQLHANELPLRHLFKFIDGSTSGPNEFSGPIGKELQNCHNMPITTFVVIEVQLPDLLTSGLSTDQKYLYEICLAIASGRVPNDLARRNPGKMSHARWLTTGSRILRLYVATKNPSPNLVTLATFVIKVYAPTWFKIKYNSSCCDGARNLWFLTHNSRYLPDELKAVVDPVIQRNAYFSHPENLLLSMLTDDDRKIRELACRRILKARSLNGSKGSIPRTFEIPVINFESDVYYDMIDWQSAELKLTEPPLLSCFERKFENHY